MKSLICILAALFSLTAQAASIEFEPIAYEDLDKGDFIDCHLEDGRTLKATYAMVYTDKEVLAKSLLGKSQTPSSDRLHYASNGISVTAYKQFSGREGYQGVIVTHDDGLSQQLSCIERNED